MADDVLLRSWIHHDFGIEMVALDVIDAGADTAAAVWRGTSTDGSRYAVKWTSGGSPAGLSVPGRLAALGVPGIAAPIPARSGAPWTSHDGRRLALLPWVSDDDGLAGRMTREHWKSFGRLLAAVHDAAVTDAGPEPAASGALGSASSAGSVIAALEEIDRRLDSVVRDGDADDLVRELATAWRAGTELLARVRDRVTTLERTTRGQARHPERPTVLCHTDAHLGNVLLGDDGEVWLIDWDDATAAPRERDLMFVVGGLPGFAPVGAREQEWFLAGYGPAELDPDLLSYYRGVRALDDIAELAAEVLDGTDHAERARWLAFVRAELAGDGLAGLALHDTP